MKSIVIVGGGTAGWLTAGIIAARHGANRPGGIAVTLIESPNVPTIGVGEGTWPTMRRTLQAMGIAEAEFLTQCDATFKQGSKFINWMGKAEPGQDAYYHPFTAPAGFGSVDLAALWEEGGKGIRFCDAVSVQPALCDRGLAPKEIVTPEYAGMANYAYHLDAGKFAAFLRRHCIDKLGVTHVRADVIGVENDGNGYVDCLRLAGREPLGGDLFVDCTGFSALLVGKHYGVPFKSCRDKLFIDTALAVQIPYAEPGDPIASATLSTAQSAGWIWDIGLPTRRGVGYVYASAYIAEEEALAELSAYIAPNGPALQADEVRKIAIDAGYREEFWVKNCVAVGLSSGFVEPLEASSIIMVEMAAQMIANQLPASRDAMRIVGKRFNALFLHRWEGIIDFLKLHYVLSRRDDPFWVANRAAGSVPDSLRDSLELWRHRTVAPTDFPLADEMFSAASYQYILQGMGHEMRPPDWTLLSLDGPAADIHFREVVKAREALAGRLPANRALLEKIALYGLQKV